MSHHLAHINRLSLQRSERVTLSDSTGRNFLHLLLLLLLVVVLLFVVFKVIILLFWQW
ncbi:MAG: hypothetical protein ACK56I_01355 [bacterium]